MSDTITFEQAACFLSTYGSGNVTELTLSHHLNVLDPWGDTHHIYLDDYAKGDTSFNIVFDDETWVVEEEQNKEVHISHGTELHLIGGVEWGSNPHKLIFTVERHPETIPYTETDHK
jgi:hypothetical protein